MFLLQIHDNNNKTVDDTKHYAFLCFHSLLFSTYVNLLFLNRVYPNQVNKATATEGATGCGRV